MNSIKIMINNKETLSELVKDPEVEVRIKDSVIDGIVKRAEKNCLFKDLKMAVAEAMHDFTHPKKANDLFDGVGSWGTCRLSDKAIEIVKCQIKAHVDSIINEEIQNSLKSIVDELKSEIARYKSNVDKNKKTVEEANKFLREYDYEKKIREMIDSKINGGLGKVIVSSFFAAEGKAEGKVKGVADES